MAPGRAVEHLRPLLWVTLRRSAALGKFFLGYGTVMALLLGIALALTAGPSFASAFPVLFPIFGTVGSMGALTVFTSDRTKGTLEYLLAYGLSPRRIFTNVLVSCLALVTIVVVVGGSVGVGVYLARGYAVSATLAIGLGLYAIPMAYASAAFATMAGMYWSALSSPSTAMNSPIGVAPLIGILPPVAVLILLTATGITGVFSLTVAFEIAVGMMAGIGTLTLALLGLLDRLLRPERLLSPA